jgi:anti-sigma factor RsiW
MLPDLLHRTLPADVRGRVEAHVAACDECREELRFLRTVQSAAVFAPEIDVDKVVRQIPPYQRIVPAAEMPARSRPRLVSWLAAATLAITVVGVGSLLVRPQDAAVAPTPVAIATRPPALALAADVDGLSDGNLVQLMNDMNRFDALPATELDPVIPVDTGDSIGQVLR